MEPMNVQRWVEEQKRLLGMERDAERAEIADNITQLSAEECQRKGLSVLSLAIQDVTTALYGRTCVTVGDTKGRPLPANSFSSGSQVQLRSGKGAEGVQSSITGVVRKVTEHRIEIVSDDEAEENDALDTLAAPLRLDMLASEVTHKKLMQGLLSLSKYEDGPALKVKAVLFGAEQPSLLTSSPPARAATGADGPDGGSAMSHVSTQTNISTTVNDESERLGTIGGRNSIADGVGGGMAGRLTPFNCGLNGSQLGAVSFALSTDDIALIHGPPGTGKTTAVVELIMQAVARGWKVLVCAPSNVGVDNILERLAVVKEAAKGKQQLRKSAPSSSTSSSSRQHLVPLPNMMRLGHPARLSEAVMQHSLESLTHSHEHMTVVNDVKAELQGLLEQLSTVTGSKRKGKGGDDGGGGNAKRKRLSTADKRVLRQEVKMLRKEVRKREDVVVKSVLEKTNVVLATCVGCETRLLRDIAFDLVVIDEAAQALEAACWLPIMKGRRIVLAGDHKQLPPTIKMKDATFSAGRTGGGNGVSDGGLELTLFDRVLAKYGKGISTMLDTQYRMHDAICAWASGEMYDGLLKSHESVASRLLADLEHVKAVKLKQKGEDEEDEGGGGEVEDSKVGTREGLELASCGDTESNSKSSAGEQERGEGVVDESMTSATLLLIDSTGCQLDEVKPPEGDGSCSNPGEAAVVAAHVRALLRSGLIVSDIAVITPYNGQVDELRKLLRPQYPLIEVRSVDGFQGGEKEAVVLSLVRSNDKGQVGFLKDDRRLNVAVTRAKRHCAIVANVECCSRGSAFLKRLLQYFEDNGEYRSALEVSGACLAADTKGQSTATSTSTLGDEAASLMSKLNFTMSGKGGSQSQTGGAVEVHYVKAQADVHDGKFGETERAQWLYRGKQKAGCSGGGGCHSGTVFSDGEVERMVRGFASSSEVGAILKLPVELPARQRALCHTICDDDTLPLSHSSVQLEAEGEGGASSSSSSRAPIRQLVLTKLKLEGRAQLQSNTTTNWSESAIVGQPGNGESSSPAPPCPPQSQSPSFIAGDEKQRRGFSGSDVAAAIVSEDGDDDSNFKFNADGGGEGDDDGDVNDGRAGDKAKQEAQSSGDGEAQPLDSCTLLARLAKERMERERQKAAAAATKEAAQQASTNGGKAAAAKQKKRDKKKKSVSPSKGTGGGGSGGSSGGGGIGGASSSSSSSSAAAAAAAAPAGAEGDDIDDDMVFLEQQINKIEAAQPCYTRVLNMTSQVMREGGYAGNPKRPARSDITNGKRTVLAGQLHKKLGEQSSKRIGDPAKKKESVGKK